MKEGSVPPFDKTWEPLQEKISRVYLMVRKKDAGFKTEDGYAFDIEQFYLPSGVWNLYDAWLDDFTKYTDDPRHELNINEFFLTGSRLVDHLNTELPERIQEKYIFRMADTGFMKDEIMKMNYELGRIELQNRKYDTAYYYFMRCYNANKRSITLLKELAFCCHMTDRTQEAIRFGMELVDRNPDNAEAHNNLGVIYSEYGNMHLAYEFFIKAHRLSPGDECYAYNLAVCCSTMKKYDQAEPLLRKLCGEKKKEKNVIDALVQLYSETGNYPLEYKFLLLKEKLFPETAEGFLETGLFLGRNRKFRKALSHFHKALDLDKDDPFIYFNLALTYSLIGEDDNALQVYFNAVIRDPNLAVFFWAKELIMNLKVDYSLRYDILKFAAYRGDKKAEEAIQNNSWI